MSLSNHPCLNSTKSPLLSTHDKEKLTVRSKSPQFLKPSDVHVASSFINCHGTINTPTSNPDTTSNARGKSKNITSISSSSTSNSRAINTCSTSMATSVAGSDPPSPPVASASSSSSSTSTCGGNIFIAVPPFPVTTVASNIASAVDASTSITTTASLPTATTSTYKTAVADSVIRQDDDTSAEDIYITAISYSSSSSGKRNVDPSCVHFNNITLANRVGTENSCCRLSPTTQESVEHSRCNSGRSNSPKSSTTCSTCTLSCSCSCNSSCTSKCYCNCTRSGSCVSSSFSHSPKKKSPQTSGRGIATTSTRESVNCDQETEASSSGLLTKAKSNIVKPKESVLTSSTPPADSGYCSCCFGKNSPTTHAETPVSFNASSSISTASLTSRAQNAGATSVSNCDTTVTKGEILVSGAKTPRTPLCSTGTTPSPPSPKRTTAVNSGKIGLGKGLLTSKPVQFASRQTGLQASPAKSAPSNGNPDGRKKNTVPTTHSSSPSKHRNHKLCFPKQIQQTRQQKSCAGITRRGSNVSNVSRSGGWKFNKMGNGSSHGGGGHVVIDGESLEVSRIKSLIPEMRRELRKKESMIARYEAELHDKIRELKERTADIQRLRGEVHKLRSVLQLKVCNEEGRPDILATIQETLPNNNAGDQRLKRQGVSGESYNNSGGFSSIELKHHEKDFRSRQLIKDSILENDFLKNLDQNQVREIVDCMYEKKVKMGHFIIKEGESGQHLYVSAEGEFDVVKGKQVLGKMGPGRAFGELAILYNCTRTASIRAVSDVRIWVLDRRVFQAIMMKTGIQRREENIQFLKSVSLLKELPNDKLAKIADVLEVDFFRGGEYVIREDAYGDSFFIINRGEVKVTQTIQGHTQPQEIRRLKRGDYFGERALLSEDRRTANVIALGQGVECLTVDRNSFNQLIGDLNELKEKDYGDEARGAHRSSGGQGSSTQETHEIHEIESPTKEKHDKDFDDIRLEYMEVIATLGVGGFGRVELVQLTTDKSRTFALKCLKKKHIVETRQQDHIYSEKKIMMDSKSPFVVKMYRTFSDKKYVYMLMEACLGGELWSILRDKGQFDEGMSRFYIACVLEALEYLHGKHIIYRDLKPENLLLDKQGYIKLVDFGFAKHVPSGRKTWTFCGTPEYVAPEIILNKGHDHAVDYWGLGILMFELLNGTPPFSGHDPMKTYNVILKGIDVIEFPKRFSRNSILLIKKLCRENPSERLGYGKNGLSDIKKNKWFQGFDWDGLKKQKLIPPIIPKVRSQCDHSNFDQYTKDTEIPPDETSGWDIDF